MLYFRSCHGHGVASEQEKVTKTVLLQDAWFYYFWVVGCISRTSYDLFSCRLESEGEMCVHAKFGGKKWKGEMMQWQCYFLKIKKRVVKFIRWVSSHFTKEKDR